MTIIEYVTDKLQGIRNQIKTQQVVQEANRPTTDIQKAIARIELLCLRSQELALDAELRRIAPKGTVFTIK